MTVSASRVSVAMAESPWHAARRRFLANRLARFSLVYLCLIAIAVIIVPAASSTTYYDADWDNISAAPSAESGHLFGTDSIGRDVFLRTFYGGRLSLAVGIVATFVSLSIGVAYGAIAGYLGGRVDQVMMRAVDVLYALPFMFLVILLMSLFGRSIILIFVAIGAINWLDIARIVRGQALALKRKEFVEAARAAGTSDSKIVRRHIVPNLLGVVVVYVSLTIPQVILVESFLSYLGLGIQEPMTSWGALVSEGAKEMETAPWMLLFPSAFLVSTLFCFNFVGDGLRDALDPKSL